MANLLYFLHPTIMPPFNTAIVNGYNALTGSKVRLARWPDYLAMRQGLLQLNTRHRERLSNDLGAIGGLLFDLGSGRYQAPPLADDGAARLAWAQDLHAVREHSAKEAKRLAQERETEHTHTQIQGWLRDLGLALGHDVWIASNDRSRPWQGGRLGDGCLTELPGFDADTQGAASVRLIDVLWLDREQHGIVAAFEVEHSTTIYSGVVRMLDLALGPAAHALQGLFLVAPDQREADVREQLRRPAFSRIADLQVRYLSYTALEQQREPIARFGHGLKPMQAISHALTGG